MAFSGMGRHMADNTFTNFINDYSAELSLIFVDLMKDPVADEWRNINGKEPKKYLTPKKVE